MTASRTSFLVLLIGCIILTRLPLLFTGYGSDPDAWRVAHVARTLWTSGTYEMSRSPGYPAHEVISSPLVALGGSVLSNAATLFASIVAVILWYAFIRNRTQRPGMLTIAFAFAPLFWVNSASTMDYNWSLLMILLAMHTVTRLRPVSAGLLFGLAIGFRPTNAVLLVPLAMLLTKTSPSRSPLRGFARNDSKNDVVVTPGRRVRSSLTLLFSFAASCCVTVAVVFLPVLLTYGIAGWFGELHGQFGSTSLSAKDAMLFFAYRAVYAIGPLAFLGMAWILLRKGAFAAAWKSRDPILVSSLTALGVLTLSFALFPFEKSYLLSGLPFLLLVIDRLATSRALALFTIFVVSFAFVNPDVIRHGGARGAPAFNIHTGMVIEEWQKRKELDQWRKQLASVVAPAQTVIMTGLGPAFWFENDAVEPVQDPIVRDVHDVVVQRRGNPSLLYVPMIPREEAERLKQMGWRVMSDARNRDYIEQTTGYRVDAISSRQGGP